MKNLGSIILGIIIGALLMYFFGSQYIEVDPMPMASSAPKGIISPKEAKTLDQAYNLRHRIINDSLFRDSKTGDNRSSWWAIEDIQNYINHAENQAGELGYTMDGLRVYLGAYPGANGEAGLTTMFFVPTGTPNKSQGSMFPLLQGGSHDIKGADGLNIGSNGHPPGSNYPQ